MIDSKGNDFQEKSKLRAKDTTLKIECVEIRWSNTVSEYVADFKELNGAKESFTLTQQSLLTSGWVVV